MDDSKTLRKSFLTNSSYQKWLILVNTILVLFLVVFFILVGSAWFSDRMMLGMINNIVSPRLNRLIQKNPEVLYDLTKKLNSESIAPMINRHLKKDPKLLSRYVKSIDPVLVAGALNNVMKENSEQITLLLKNMDAKALAELKNNLLVNNKNLLVALLTSFDHRAVGGDDRRNDCKRSLVFLGSRGMHSSGSVIQGSQ